MNEIQIEKLKVIIGGLNAVDVIAMLPAIARLIPRLNNAMLGDKSTTAKNDKIEGAPANYATQAKNRATAK